MLAHSEIQTIISALGCGIAEEFTLEKVRYGKTIIMTIHQPAKDEFEKFNLAE